MKKLSFWGVLLVVVLVHTGFAQETTSAGTAASEEQQKQSDKKESEYKIDEIVVQGKKEAAGAPGIPLTPGKTVIELDKFSTIGTPDSVMDLLKTQAAVDFRGESDRDPGIDSIYLRGFDTQSFVTALDGLTVQKTGGRKSTNIVDYSLLPAFLIERIEILPGPHSAMYDAKAIGGVINFISKAPKRRDTAKPDVSLSTSYSSYNTLSSNSSVRGSVSDFTYDLAYRKSSTDGYLRQSANDMDTAYGRFGFILPDNGFITLSASYSDIDRQVGVNNPSSDKASDYDPDYPITTGRLHDPYQDHTWDGTSAKYRFNYEQSLAIGRLNVGTFYDRDTRDRMYYTSRKVTEQTHQNTNWWQQGGKIMDAIQWNSDHITTVGFDMVQMYDDGFESSKTKRIEKTGTFFQHQWSILPSLDTTLGARYENLDIWITNSGLFERHFGDLIPKSFTTWKMDSLAPCMRDTSLSAGISRIWHGPDAHGIYNPQGRPLGLTLEPEHGIGYDLIFNRRIWQDIGVKIGYSFYSISDYIASSVNVDEVHRHGVDLELGGHLFEPLSFYLTYAWQDFINKGGETTGATSVDQRAKHRIGAGLRYDLFANTQLQLDYAYQSDEITEIWQDDILVGEQQIDAYHVVDFGVSQKLFKQAGWFKDGVLKIYVKNLFDEEYYNSTGVPAIDRTFGISLSLNM